MFNSVIHCGSAKAPSNWQSKRRIDGHSDFLARQHRAIQTTLILRPMRFHYLEMDADIIDQVGPHIREIVRICRAFYPEGRELQELNGLVRRTSKCGFIQAIPVR